MPAVQFYCILERSGEGEICVLMAEKALPSE